jgi:hypothetical protein
VFFDPSLFECADVLQIIGEKGYEMDYEYSPCIMNTGIAVDECTLSLCPTDIPQDTILYPVTITADGWRSFLTFWLPNLGYTENMLRQRTLDRAKICQIPMYDLFLVIFTISFS